MSKQAQVGAFALVALGLLFGVFFTITDFASRHSGYRIGVHFNTAAGLHSGALVYFSGVTAGSVDSIDLLPDHTVDVILAINREIDIPRDSKFLIQAPLTGDPNLVIVPPTPKPRPPGIVGPTPAPNAAPLLAREVLPIDQQPQGSSTATISDLLEQGQGEVKRLDVMLADLQKREPALLNTLQSTLANANSLTVNANEQVRSLFGALQPAIARASTNIVDLTDTLNSTVASNSGKVDALLTNLNSTAVGLNQSVSALKSIATNPNVKQNLVQTTQSIADATHTIADLTRDLRQITGNPQTQAQLRDTVAQLDAATQKANSLLAALGGTSHVAGVDTGATPAPSGGAGPPNSPPGAPGGVPQNLKSKISGIARNLYAIQVRVGELSPQRTIGSNPLLTSDRGPQADFNILFLPKGNTSLLVGANDIGSKTTWNFAEIANVGSGFRLGGGVLYSQLGGLAQYWRDRIGVEGRLYNLRRPTLDAYLNARVTPLSQLFIGERDLTRAERRTVFGLQLQF
ncbi:MAG: MCE family protein [Candidatus Eremiobacteraeota bacterium]|nr:MCE family protein [Candidatus Eremiobacteraeota bacterium]